MPGYGTFPAPFVRAQGYEQAARSVQEAVEEGHQAETRECMFPPWHEAVVGHGPGRGFDIVVEVMHQGFA